MSTIVRVAGKADVERILEYVQTKYGSKFNTRPSFIAQDCFIAEADDRVVGVLAVEFSEGEPFGIEEYFVFDYQILGFGRKEAVSFSRWIADQPHVAPALGVMGLSLALDRGRSFSLSCAKPALMRHLQKRYGLPMDKFFTPLNPEKIPEEDRNFFLTHPRPGLYVGRLDTCYNVLMQKLDPRVELQR